MKKVTLVLALVGALNGQERLPRVFINNTTTGYNHSNYNAEAGLVMKQLIKKCPEVTITTNLSNADFVVSLQSGIPSNISTADGDILKRFGIWQGGYSIAKDVCRIAGGVDNR